MSDKNIVGFLVAIMCFCAFFVILVFILFLGSTENIEIKDFEYNKLYDMKSAIVDESDKQEFNRLLSDSMADGMINIDENEKLISFFYGLRKKQLVDSVEQKGDNNE